MYYKTMVSLDQDHKLCEVFLEENLPRITNRKKDMKFSDRRFKCKIARVVYKLIRGFYATFIFYWTPFIFLNLQFIRFLLTIGLFVAEPI